MTPCTAGHDRCVLSKCEACLASVVHYSSLQARCILAASFATGMHLRMLVANTMSATNRTSPQLLAPLGTQAAPHIVKRITGYRRTCAVKGSLPWLARTTMAAVLVSCVKPEHGVPSTNVKIQDPIVSHAALTRTM